MTQPGRWDSSRRSLPASDVLRWVSCEQNGVMVLSAHGEIDWASAPILRESLAGVMVGRVPRVLLVLAEVTFLDSSGLSVLIRAQRQADARGGWVRLAAPGPQVRRVLRMTDVGESFRIYATLEVALARCGVLPMPSVAIEQPGGTPARLWTGPAGSQQAALN